MHDTREGERVGQYDGTDLVVRADHVERDESEPVNCVDAIGEQNEPRLIESTGTLSGLESVESGRDYEKEGEEEAGHEAFIDTLKQTLKVFFPLLGLPEQTRIRMFDRKMCFVVAGSKMSQQTLTRTSTMVSRSDMRTLAAGLVQAGWEAAEKILEILFVLVTTAE